MADHNQSNWDSEEAKKRHDERQRRKTLDEDMLFKTDNFGGPFPTIFSQEETWITRRDSHGHREKTHTVIRTNQESTGRVLWEKTEAQYDPENPEKEPIISIQKEETQLHPPDELRSIGAT